MIMDNRKKRILQAIIDDYIDKAEPIGSRTIARKYELGLSSATIRNEMADLEEMGYLAQPHTSAGRVPSDKGYRLYVDKLMPTRDLNHEETRELRSAMETRVYELGQLLKQATTVLSGFTKYTSMAVTPRLRSSTIKAIQVVPIEAGNALVIVVNNAGIVRSTLIKVSEQATSEMLGRITNMLNDRLTGLTFEQADTERMKDLGREIGVSGEILKPILDGTADCIYQMQDHEIFVEGSTNILNHPEFKDMDKARQFLSLLDERTSIGRALSESARPYGITVRIGSENELSGIRDCSLVMVSYNVSDTMVGTLGIIGPTRMEYSKVISSISYMKKLMNGEIGKLLGREPENV
jgi:heat-inducible transcriptional repressor